MYIVERMLKCQGNPRPSGYIQACSLAGSRFKAYKAFESAIVTTTIQMMGAAVKDKVIGEQGSFVPALTELLEQGLNINPRYRESEGNLLMHDFYLETYDYHNGNQHVYGSGVLEACDELLVVRLESKPYSNARQTHVPIARTSSGHASGFL